MTRNERIPFNWTFFGFETPVGNRPIRDWIRSLPDEATDELVDILIYMRIRPSREWAAEHFKPLEEGISEIRFKGADFVFRIYGYFGPDWHVQSYTFLVGTEKKVKNQRDAKNLAKSRRAQIQRREARVHVFSVEE